MTSLLSYIWPWNQAVSEETEEDNGLEWSTVVENPTLQSDWNILGDTEEVVDLSQEEDNNSNEEDDAEIEFMDSLVFSRVTQDVEEPVDILELVPEPRPRSQQMVNPDQIARNIEKKLTKENKLQLRQEADLLKTKIKDTTPQVFGPARRKRNRSRSKMNSQSKPSKRHSHQRRN